VNHSAATLEQHLVCIIELRFLLNADMCGILLLEMASLLRKKKEKKKMSDWKGQL